MHRPRVFFPLDRCVLCFGDSSLTRLSFFMINVVLFYEAYVRCRLFLSWYIRVLRRVVSSSHLPPLSYITYYSPSTTITMSGNGGFVFRPSGGVQTHRQSIVRAAASFVSIYHTTHSSTIITRRLRRLRNSLSPHLLA